MLQFAAIVPNLYGFQEYPAKPEKQPSWYAPHFEVKNGMLAIPVGPGLGISYDDSVWHGNEKL
jgi:L-alanine-DL-glutamate epimerase-like enolase superfamily enzyme